MRLRFTIRDLLWLTLVVGLIVGWWVDHSRQPRDEFWRVSYQNGEIVVTDSGGQIIQRVPAYLEIGITGRSLNGVPIE